MRKFMVIALLSFSTASAQGGMLDISLAGWESWGEWHDAGNSSGHFVLPAGSTIDSIEYIDLEFEAIFPSYHSELILSVNDTYGAIDFWDSFIPGTLDDSGDYGPVSGSFENPGVFGSGPFTLSSGDLYVEVYEDYDDAGQDAEIRSGTLRVHYSTVPEPCSVTLAGLGALALIRRRFAV